jgi:hypothetical protein
MGRRSSVRLLVLSAVTIVVAFQGLPSAGHEPSAHRLLNPSHFNGDGSGGGSQVREAQIVSDAFDGRNRGYELRAIASRATRYYQWFSCPPGGRPFRGECNLLVRDATPYLSRPPVGIPRVATFSALFNIAAGVHANRDIVGMACIDGPPARPAHCIFQRLDVHLDDADDVTDHPVTDSGRIAKPLHGRSVANEGFRAVAFTHATDIGRLFFCLDLGTSPAQRENVRPHTNCDPGSGADPTPNDGLGCPGTEPAGSECWSLLINPPNNQQFSLSIIEQDNVAGTASSGSGDCENDTLLPNPGGDDSAGGDDCQLDQVYLTSRVICPGQANDPRRQIKGNAANNLLVGGARGEVICGLAGNDVLRGRGGNDLLLGGTGNDAMNGGAGRDRCIGGPGRDIRRRCEA